MTGMYDGGTRWAWLGPMADAETWDAMGADSHAALVASFRRMGEANAVDLGLDVAWDTFTVQRQAIGMTVELPTDDGGTAQVYLPPMVALHMEGTINRSPEQKEPVKP